MRNIVLFALLAAVGAERIHLGFNKNLLRHLKRQSDVSTLERTGKPSFKPTRSPEASPSAEPTASPVYSSGWFVQDLSSEGCDSNPDQVFAVRTGTCLKSYVDAEETVPFYAEITCYTGKFFFVVVCWV